MSLADALKAELLQNGRVRPAEFCAEYGCHKDSVRWYTQQLIGLGMLEKVKEQGLSGRMIETCRVVDWTRMERWEPTGSVGRQKYRWDGLMRAFGVNLRNIAGLPTTKHVIPWGVVA